MPSTLRSCAARCRHGTDLGLFFRLLVWRQLSVPAKFSSFGAGYTNNDQVPVNSRCEPFFSAVRATPAPQLGKVGVRLQRGAGSGRAVRAVQRCRFKEQCFAALGSAFGISAVRAVVQKCRAACSRPFMSTPLRAARGRRGCVAAQSSLPLCKPPYVSTACISSIRCACSRVVWGSGAGDCVRVLLSTSLVAGRAGLGCFSVARWLRVRFSSCRYCSHAAVA